MLYQGFGVRARGQSFWYWSTGKCYYIMITATKELYYRTCKLLKKFTGSQKSEASDCVEWSELQSEILNDIVRTSRVSSLLYSLMPITIILRYLFEIGSISFLSQALNVSSQNCGLASYTGTGQSISFLCRDRWHRCQGTFNIHDYPHTIFLFIVSFVTFLSPPFSYYNSYVNMSCIKGYSLKNRSTIVQVYCGIDGSWIYPEDQCLSKYWHVLYNPAYFKINRQINLS